MYNLIDNLNFSSKEKASCKDISLIKDKDYANFIRLKNGGMFFEFSVFLYSHTVDNIYNNINFVNAVIEKEFGELFEGLYSFGCDAFGNQFTFSEKAIIFFNIETGERDEIASNFKDWINNLFKDLEYLSGYLITKKWIEKNGEWDKKMRLCPKIPFILGGEYNINNLYAKDIFDNLKYNASIAKQVYNLPDGTNFELDIK